MLAYTYILLFVWSAFISARPIAPRGITNGSLDVPGGGEVVIGLIQAFDVGSNSSNINTTVSSNATSTAEPVFSSSLVHPLFPEPGPLVTGPGPEIFPSGIASSIPDIPRDFNSSVLGGAEDELNGGGSVTGTNNVTGTSSADPAHPSARIDSLLHGPKTVDSLSSTSAFRRSNTHRKSRHRHCRGSIGIVDSFNASALLEGVKSVLNGDSASSGDAAHPSTGPVAGGEKTSLLMETDSAGFQHQRPVATHIAIHLG
ncbi:hypothetical protein DENSPDRAFT_853168 [Dentipellis sp. KUC8613]|nr:hypothetical protein DENSPDRAFT_853168 [Dentipellis sp. KUC8613]